MTNHTISHAINIRYSQSGKMDVVKGAMSDRIDLEETFVQKFMTLKSYGLLVAILYDDGARI
jgi:hypothetical protein